MDDANAAFLAYREIKSRIVNLQYKLGEKLSEARLVAELGLGRSPIRTALARLKSEGWVAVSAQSGTFVKALTDRDIEQVTELRTLLEIHCARAAATSITEAELRGVRADFATLGPRCAAGDSEAFIELDMKFHVAIYRAADNELIVDILLNLRDKVQWIRRACAVSLERVQDGFHELEAIRDALEARQGDLAGERMRAHIQNAAAFCRNIDRRSWGIESPTRARTRAIAS